MSDPNSDDLGGSLDNLPDDVPDDVIDEAPSARAKAKKSPSAFRTISEVADELHIPQHVLRFWETKFPQVKPLKRGGGRRYYRPGDITLLRRISDLLYIQGYTIKGVQRLLREGGGKLSDNIPPPNPEERETADAASLAAEAERGAGPAIALEPMLPMPGLIPSDGPASAQLRASARTGTRTNSRAKADTHSVAQSEAITASGSDLEVARLRRVLTEVLAELEAIRATLD